MFALADWVVLIRRRLDFQVVALEHQPGPAAAKDFGCSLGKFFPETRETAKVLVNRCLQFSLRLTSAVRFHHLPEKRMIEMATALVPDGEPDFLRHSVQVLEEFFSGFFAEVWKLGDGF